MTTPTWYVEEIALAGDEHLDPTYAPTYDAKAGTDPAEDLAALRGLGLSGSSTLVDLGAGTGTLAIAAAPLCRRVVAVDVSSQMLAVLRAKVEASGADNVEAVQAGFLSYHHRGAPADIVYSRHALHHLPDFWKAVALVRIAAILKPGGTLYLRDLVYSFQPTETEAAVEAWLAGAASDASAGWTRPELETHLRDEHSTFTWLLEPMIERAGFTITAAEYPGPTYATYTCFRDDAHP